MSGTYGTSSDGISDVNSERSSETSVKSGADTMHTSGADTMHTSGADTSVSTSQNGADMHTSAHENSRLYLVSMHTNYRTQIVRIAWSASDALRIASRLRDGISRDESSDVYELGTYSYTDALGTVQSVPHITNIRIVRYGDVTSEYEYRAESSELVSAQELNGTYGADSLDIHELYTRASELRILVSDAETLERYARHLDRAVEHLDRVRYTALSSLSDTDSVQALHAVYAYLSARAREYRKAERVSELGAYECTECGATKFTGCICGDVVSELVSRATVTEPIPLFTPYRVADAVARELRSLYATARDTVNSSRGDTARDAVSRRDELSDMLETLSPLVSALYDAARGAYTCTECGGTRNACICDVTEPTCTECGTRLRPSGCGTYGYCHACMHSVQSMELYTLQRAIERQYSERAEISRELREIARSLSDSNWVAWALSVGAVRTDVGSYLSLRDFKELSYYPSGRELETPSETSSELVNNWNSRYRISGRIGRMVRKLVALPWALSDSDVEQFVNHVTASNPALVTERIELVSGEDIRDAYHERNYARDGIGTMESSCMRYERCQEYLSLYVENSDVCQLAVLRDESGDVTARALLWRQEDGSMYLDRVYGTDAVQLAFRHWAESNGYDAAPSTVKLRHAAFESYPYCDTYRYLNLSERRISAEYQSGYGWSSDYLSDTYGGRGAHEYTCTECGDGVSDDDVYVSDYGDAYCAECWHEHTCRACDEFSDDVRDGYCETCRDERTCTACGAIDTSWNSRDSHSTELGTLCGACLSERTCSECGDVHELSELYEDESGESLCETCTSSDVRAERIARHRAELRAQELRELVRAESAELVTARDAYRSRATAQAHAGQLFLTWDISVLAFTYESSYTLCADY